MTPEEQQAFVDVVTGSLTAQEIEDLEDTAERAEFEADVNKVYSHMANVSDVLAQSTDIYVVAAALEMLAAEYINITEGDEDEAE